MKQKVYVYRNVKQVEKMIKHAFNCMSSNEPTSSTDYSQKYEFVQNNNRQVENLGPDKVKAGNSEKMNLTREDMKQNRQHQRERERKTWDPYFPHNKICSLQQHWLRDQHQLQTVLGVSTKT